MSDPSAFRILTGLRSSEPSQAWSEFLDAYSPLILRVVRLFERDEDRVSDCFLFVCEHLVENRFRRLGKFRLDGPASFETWLRAVVRNLCLDWRRQEFGRHRIFQTVARLSPIDRAVFHCIYEQACTPDAVTGCLAARFPSITQAQVANSIDLIEQVLTPRQRRLLLERHNGVQMESYARNGGDEFLLQVVDATLDPESATSQQEGRIALQRALWRLPGQERLLIFFRLIREMTLEEVALLFDMKGNQDADRRIREVLDHLRQEMGKKAPAPGNRTVLSVK